MSLLTQNPGQQAHTHSAEAFVPDQSRAERTQSYDVADFPLPSGREEDWRCTPISRLTTLLADEASSATLEWTTHLPEGVTLTTTSVEELGRDSLPKPVDRPAALAAAHGEGIALVDVPKEAELTEPVRIHLDGARLANAAASLGCSLAALTSEAGVDVVSLGGTKNGALGAEEDGGGGQRGQPDAHRDREAQGDADDDADQEDQRGDGHGIHHRFTSPGSGTSPPTPSSGA